MEKKKKLAPCGINNRYCYVPVHQTHLQLKDEECNQDAILIAKSCPLKTYMTVLPSAASLQMVKHASYQQYTVARLMIELQ